MASTAQTGKPQPNPGGGEALASKRKLTADRSTVDEDGLSNSWFAKELKMLRISCHLVLGLGLSASNQVNLIDESEL